MLRGLRGGLATTQSQQLGAVQEQTIAIQEMCAARLYHLARATVDDEVRQCLIRSLELVEERLQQTRARRAWASRH